MVGIKAAVSNNFTAICSRSDAKKYEGSNFSTIAKSTHQAKSIDSLLSAEYTIYAISKLP